MKLSDGLLLPFHQLCLQHAASTEVSGSLSEETPQNLFVFVQMFILSLTGRSQMEKYLSHLQQYLGYYYKKRCHRKCADKMEENADTLTTLILL